MFFFCFFFFFFVFCFFVFFFFFCFVFFSEEKKMKISSEKKPLIFLCVLVEAVLTRTHNVCFGLRILGIPLQTPVFLLHV